MFYSQIDVFLELSCFFNDPADVGNLISGSSAFSKTSLNIWKFTVPVLLKPGLENFELVYKYFILCLQVSLCCRTINKHNLCHNSISSESHIHVLFWSEGRKDVKLDFCACQKSLVLYIFFSFMYQLIPSLLYFFKVEL